MGDRIQQAQEVLDHQAHEQEMQRQSCSLEQTLLSLRATAESWDGLIFIKRCYSQFRIVWMDCDSRAIASTLAQVQQSGDHQLKTLLKCDTHSLVSYLAPPLPHPKRDQSPSTSAIV